MPTRCRVSVMGYSYTAWTYLPSGGTDSGLRLCNLSQVRVTYGPRAVVIHTFYYTVALASKVVMLRIRPASRNSSVFVGARTCLPRRCVAKAVSSGSTIPTFRRLSLRLHIQGSLQSEPLFSNRSVLRAARFEQLLERTQTHRQQDDLISLLFFFTVRKAG
jgi:hypothetical protein